MTIGTETAKTGRGLFGYFERLVDPFPEAEPERPPARLLPFLLHYSRPVAPWLLLMSLLTAAISAIEIALVGYVGQLVDRLAAADRATFLDDHGAQLAVIGVLLVVSYPLIVLASSLVPHQTIFGNYPMLARWLAHRYILGQSLAFIPGRVRGAVQSKGDADGARDPIVASLVDGQGRIGLDAHAGERGVKLSGGQRQRIAIARALLKDTPIVVLDEATSALDSEVEAAIQEQLGTLMQGKTVLAIAHRLSTIAALDRLVVMDGGRIVEAGTHDALIARGRLYADLWRRQSGGILNCDAVGADADRLAG